MNNIVQCVNNVKENCQKHEIERTNIHDSVTSTQKLANSNITVITARVLGLLFIGRSTIAHLYIYL